MIGIEIVAKLAELQKQYDDAHRPTRPLEAYRRRHARRHPKLDFDGEQHDPAIPGVEPISIPRPAHSRAPRFASPLGLGVKPSERRQASNKALSRGFQTCTCGGFSA